MKSIYGKLILGFLVSILFSFSIAGYFSLKKNSTELGRLAIEELENSSQLINDLLLLIDREDLSHVLKGYADTSEVSFFLATDDKVSIYGNLSGNELPKSDYNYLMKHIGETMTLSDSSMRQLATSFQVNDKTYVLFIQKDIGKREMVYVDSAMIAVFCMLIAGSITFLVIADIIVKPIGRLNKATNELSKGNYRVRVN